MDEVIDLCDSLLDVNENDITALFFKEEPRFPGKAEGKPQQLD